MRLITIVLLLLTGNIFGQDPMKVFGHRGWRGIYPENSIVGFTEVAKLPVFGVELDVVVNKDKQLVISHEPYFKSEICIDQRGNKVKQEEEFNIYKMSQSEISEFDCGSIGNPSFPDQKRIGMSKPLLKDLFQQVDFKNKTILFEVKSSPKEYGISQPYPKEFAEIILKELDSCPYRQSIAFMSFDKEILEELYKLESVRKIDQQCKFVYLTYKPFRSAKKFLKELSFKPSGMAMFYPTIQKRKTRYLHEQGIECYAWNVKKTRVINRMMRKGADGIISDYPDRAIELINGN